MTNPIQEAIETIAKEVHSIKNNPPQSQGGQSAAPQAEIGVIPFSEINFNNGYPLSFGEIKFKKEYQDEKILVRVTATFNALTQTSYVFNVYDVTKTGFKIRMNVKNVANGGLLKELYYEAIYIGVSSND